ncbi:MAG: hypothetical protein WA949_08395 [Phormidesmis sp.]
MLASKQTTFNSFLDITDPAEFLGAPLSNFSISIIYPVRQEDRGKISDIQSGIYEGIITKLSDRSLGRVNSFVRDYKDDRVPQEPSRKYLKVVFDTPRSTQVTSLIRCLVIGDNLYLAVDSYVLGGLKITALLFQISVSLVLLFLSTQIFPPFLFLAALVYLFFTWIDVYRATRQEPSLLYGLRCKFNKSKDLGSFNSDDTAMYLKSITKIVTSTTKEVFRSSGLNFDSMLDVLRGIEQKAIGQTVTVEAGGDISMFGVNIGSYNSQANA